MYEIERRGWLGASVGVWGAGDAACCCGGEGYPMMTKRLMVGPILLTLNLLIVLLLCNIEQLPDVSTIRASLPHQIPGGYRDEPGGQFR